MTNAVNLSKDEGWSAVCKSYKNRTCLTGKVAGVETKMGTPFLCIIFFGVKIIIPACEVWVKSGVPDYLMGTMYGAEVSFVVTGMDIEANEAVASRKIALKQQIKNTNRLLGLVGSVVDVSFISISRHLCTVHYGG